MLCGETHVTRKQGTPPANSSWELEAGFQQPAETQVLAASTYTRREVTPSQLDLEVTEALSDFQSWSAWQAVPGFLIQRNCEIVSAVLNH